MACLAANAGIVKRTAKECGVAHRTLRGWAAAAAVAPSLPTPAPLARPYFVPDVAEPFFGPSLARAMAAELWAVAGRALAEMSRRLKEEPESIKFRNLVRAWSMAIDRAILLDAAAPPAPEPPRGDVIDLEQCTVAELEMLERIADRTRADREPRGPADAQHITGRT